MNLSDELRSRIVARHQERVSADDDRWMYNFIGGETTVTLRVDVTAAEMGGWRAGVVIVNKAGGWDKGNQLKSVFSRSFEGAVKEAKKLARRYKIKWDPKHYSTKKDHKPGTPPPEEAKTAAMPPMGTPFGRLPDNHLLRNPNGTWSFVGSVDVRLGYLRKDGRELDPRKDAEIIENIAQHGPRLAGAKTRVFRTPYDAMKAAKKLGQGVTIAGWELEKHPEIQEGLDRSKVKHKIQ